ncbi:MAG: hypothetical protein AAGI17_10660 [Planctomycetota bacterium]
MNVWNGSTPTLVIAVAACGAAEAQFLDLSGPEAPEAGAGRAAIELSANLGRASDRLLETEGAQDGLTGLRGRAKAAFRSAAASLADLGESKRDDGSAALLWAMTLGSRAAELDELIDAVDDPAILAAMITDFDALDLEWSRGELARAPGIDEQIGSALAAVALAAVAGDRPGTGWFCGNDAVTEDNVRARAATLAGLGAGDRAVAAIGIVADEVEVLRSWPTYAARGEAIARDLTEAVDALAALPSWTPEPAKNRLVSDVGGSLELPIARRRLALRLAAQHARLLTSLDRLEDGREADRLRARASEMLATRETDDAAALPASMLAADAIALSVSRGSIRDDDHIVRELRPAWRRLVPLVRSATVTARDETLDLLVDPTRKTDPGVLATVAAQRRLFEDFALLERLSSRVGAGLDGPTELVSLVRDRLLGIAQMSADEDAQDDALEMLRAIDSQLAMLDRIAADSETAVRVMGERGRDLSARQTDLRDVWLRGWAVPGGSGPDAESIADLQLVADLTALLADAEAFTRLDTLMTWPGFEMSVRARRAIAAGLTEGIDELVPDAMRGGNAVARDRSAGRLMTLRGENAAALVAGRLARLGRDAGLTLADPMEELALGPPTDDAWMLRHRGGIADVCRYAEELGRLAVTTGRDDETRAEVRSLVNWRALRLLEAIEAERD